MNLCCVSYASRKLVLLGAVLALPGSTLSAQGLASVAIPQSGLNVQAAYRAKVREDVTSVLQHLAESLGRRDSVGTASAYTENVRSFMGKVPEAITAAGVVSQLYKTPLAGAKIAITIDDFDMSGDLAFVTSVLVAKDADDSVPVLVRSLFVFRFDDGKNRWRVREQFIDWRGGMEAPAPAQ
jgi:ketosteroid isomerase-like protein